MQFTVNHVSLEGLNVSNRPKSVNIDPGKEAAGIKFGAKRDQLRSKMGEGSFKEFKKTKTKKYPVDDFGYMHVYYNDDAQVEGVEIFDDVDVVCNSVTLIPNTFDKVVKSLKKIDENVKVNKSSIVSRKLNIGLSIRGDKVASVFAGVEGYYGSDASVESFMYENMKAYTECEPSLEALDISKINDWQLESVTGYAKFKLFGKECVSRVTIGLATDGTLVKADVDVFNQVVPKIGSILEKGIAIITAGVNDMAWVKEEGKVLSESDIKRLFKGVQDIDIGSHRDTEGNTIYPVALVKLVGNAPWDEEHGLDVIIHKGRVLCASLGGDLY